MKPGDVSIDTFTIGSFDLTDPSQAIINYLNVYEDITLPVFMADVEVLDMTDSLGQYMISGKEPVYLSFSVPGAGSVSLNLALLQGKDLDDGTEESTGSMKYKTYVLRMVSQDLLMNQAYKLQQGYNDLTSSIVQQALQTICTSSINTPDPTQGQQNITSNNEYVYDFLKGLEELHVSQQYKSSLYTLFADRMGGSEERTFCTYEYLMSQSSVFTYNQDNTVGTRFLDNFSAMSNMLWFKAPDTFNTSIVWNAPSIKQVYNKLTGNASDQTNSVVPATNDYVILGNPVTAGVLSMPNASQNPQMRGNTVNPDNDPNATGIADAKVARADYMKDLIQNSVMFEINGNPMISVGNIVTLNVPKKAATSWSDGESQLNNDVLITKLRHAIKPASVSPRYTMIVEAIKAAYYKPGA